MPRSPAAWAVRKSTDGSLRNTPFTMALLRSASARNRIFTTRESCATLRGRASVFRGGCRAGVRRRACLPPSSHFGESYRHQWQPVIRYRAVNLFQAKKLKILADGLRRLAPAERMDDRFQRDSGARNVVAALPLFYIFLRHASLDCTVSGRLPPFMATLGLCFVDRRAARNGGCRQDCPPHRFIEFGYAEPSPRWLSTKCLSIGRRPLKPSLTPCQWSMSFSSMRQQR